LYFQQFTSCLKEKGLPRDQNESGELLIIKSISFFLLIGIVSTAFASGHGPNFGLATPTNVRGGWSLDVGMMGRRGSGEGEEMVRTMLGYGITEDLQISLSAPYMFQTGPFSSGRQIAMMPGSNDFEMNLLWRFHRQDEMGKRVESTALGGILFQSPQNVSGMMGDLKKAPGFLVGGTTGFASRSTYLWAGAMYTYFMESDGDQRPDNFFYSFVWGYRPQTWRSDYPHWDWRIFVESTGERSNNFHVDGIEILESQSHQIFVGPGTLGIHNNIAIGAGIQVPIYQSVGSLHEKEKFRYALNFSYFF
jgi:hypothetical protein